ncbi:LMBR1-like membrane protein isoform 1 [Hibiscus syriacus]|uniref:LMBR1-like membrane protein isoform 1 n=1 Tax=Hibiscus syriacus TaxID=106335 RepID=A0A6A2XJD8_HIBSY|nr:uncharacterized protein LOC120166938 [Hibiscus syriacus]KAE8675662.1 LMBR1-like membrane protein isoform 1 [Hibiscus syriacus]
MDLSAPDHGSCRKHSNHQQNQGVCPCCLRERLSYLSCVPHKEASSLYFCAADSNFASPVRRRNSDKRNIFRVMGIKGMSLSSSGVKVGNGNGLKKSRSIAFVPRNLDEEEEDVENGKKRKGFWSKWVHFKEKKDVLMHSTSMRLMIPGVN